ncbi:MAG: MBL fold metallo-hydrolase [Thermodesulfobacteriota bacterium]
MNKRFHFLRGVVLLLPLLTSAINTELVSSVPAVGGIQKKSPSVSTVGSSDSQDNRPIKIEYIAHASFRIHSPDGKRIIIDPYASQIWLGYNFPKDLATDAVLITHPHYDHDAGQSRGRPFPWPKRIRVLRDPGKYAVGDISIQGVKGKHADPYGKEFGQINTIWVMNIAGLRIAHLGDNGPLSNDAIEKIGRVDILMIPIDALYHILKEVEIQAILSALNPKVIIPMHYQIPELEPSLDNPKNLGPIDPWLKDKKNVLRLENNEHYFTRKTLPEQKQFIVFKHSPHVTKLKQ